jgi:hypothetical protein
MTTSESAICPGQNTLLDPTHHKYLRVAFTVYWWNSAPSTEIFFLHDYPLVLAEDPMNELEGKVAALLGGGALQVIYQGYSGWGLSDEEALGKGKRLIVGTEPPPPIPVPDPVPTPSPTPVIEEHPAQIARSSEPV